MGLWEFNELVYTEHLEQFSTQFKNSMKVRNYYTLIKLVIIINTFGEPFKIMFFSFIEMMHYLVLSFRSWDKTY